MNPDNQQSVISEAQESMEYTKTHGQTADKQTDHKKSQYVSKNQ